MTFSRRYVQKTHKKTTNLKFVVSKQNVMRLFRFAVDENAQLICSGNLEVIVIIANFVDVTMRAIFHLVIDVFIVWKDAVENIGFLIIAADKIVAAFAI